MITDVDLNTLKKLGMKSGGFLLWVGPDRIEIYYANQGPIVFRYVAKKDKNSFALLQSMPISIALQSPIRTESEETKKQLQYIYKKLDEISVTLRIKA